MVTIEESAGFRCYFSALALDVPVTTRILDHCNVMTGVVACYGETVVGVERVDSPL